MTVGPSRETHWGGRQERQVFGFLFSTLFLILVYLNYAHVVDYVISSETNPALSQTRITRRACSVDGGTGTAEIDFTDKAIDSTLLMLYTPTTQASTFCYSDEGTANAAVDNDFLRVAAAYVSSPYSTPSSPYYDFFAAHDVTLWTVNRTTRVAAPMRLDVVYTYVNPAAPSFERHLKARNVPFEPRRYRDWEELRYSLRSLKAFVLNSSALAQYHRRHAVDMRELAGLGYRVEADPAVEGTVVPLVRRVYLLVSDVDQVPAWLNAERFPQLRVVTHADLFKAEEGQWVLPTMNSNVIESGLHRIPDISRFFLYFNNDMLVSRRASLFDLFRPLSPPRQVLEMADLVRGSVAEVRLGASGSIAAAAAERRAVFMESVFNSDGYVLPPRRSALWALAARLMPKSVCRRLAERTPGEGRTESTLRGLCIPPRLPQPPPKSSYLNIYGRYRVQESLPGVVPSVEYAHMPRIVDREVARLMAEDVEDGMGAEMKEMRQAFLRKMHPLSAAHVLESYALAMRRARAGMLWCASDAACAGTHKKSTQWTRRWLQLNRTTPCPGHPLEGVSQEVRLQHAELQQRWAGYEATWLSTAEVERPSTETAGGAKETTTSSAGNAPSKAPVRSPYTPSPPIDALLSEQTGRAVDKVTLEMLTGCHSAAGNIDQTRVQSLLFDVHHHVSTLDRNFRFYIVEDLQRAAVVLSKAEFYVNMDREAGAFLMNSSHPHPGYLSSQMPLFITINDDLGEDILERRMRGSPLIGWNVSLIAGTVFRRLLWICSYMAPPAQWERPVMDGTQ